MRIAHFVQRYPPALGGSEAYFARLSRFLAGHGEEVRVFTTNALDLEAFWSRRGKTLPVDTTVEDAVRIQRYGLLRWPGRRYVMKPLALLPIRPWQCLLQPCNPVAPRMWADCGRASYQPELVHATAFPYAWPIVCGLRLARRQGVPFLLTPFLHLGNPDDEHDRTRRAYLSSPFVWLLKCADRVFAQTNLEKSALEKHGIPAEKIILLGMGVDPLECTGGDRTLVRKKWEVVNGTVVIGHLANNSFEKGTVDLLRAAEQAWKSGARFLVVLAGPQMPNFLKFWREYRSRDKVRLLGVLSDEEKRTFFAGIDVFALPSRSDSFGLVLLEAWANGVPNIGYRAGGVAEVIQHRGDGLLVSSGNIGALASSLAELANDPALRQRLGSAGQGRIDREFRWDDKLRRVRQVYQDEAQKMR